MRPETVIRTFAAEHHGLALVADYYAAGGTRDSLRRLLERGDWIRVSRRVLRLVGAPVTDRQQALAAVLNAHVSAVLSHQSAAAVWELPGFAVLPAHITQRQPLANKRRREVGLAHWCACLSPALTTMLDAIPIVTPSFLALELFGELHPLRAERAVSTMLSRGLASKRSLESVLDGVAVQGRNGVVRLREFTESHAAHGRPAESGLERRYEQILVRAGERPMRRQVDVGGDEWLGRVDCLDEELPLIIQLDSELYHGALIDDAADQRQTKALEDAGYTVKRFTADECWHDPAYVLATVRSLRRKLRQARSA